MASYVLVAFHQRMFRTGSIEPAGASAFYFFFGNRSQPFNGFGRGLSSGLLLILLRSLFRTVSRTAFLASSTNVEERRDYAASVISADPNGEKKLLVNGIGMTTLTPITKSGDSPADDIV